MEESTSPGRPVWIAGAAGLAALLVVARGNVGAATVAALYVAVVTVPLIANDMRSRLLPNALVLPGFAFAAVGLVWAALARGSPEVLVVPPLCGATVGAGMLALASGGGLGMGDVKLAALLAVALAGVVVPAGREGGAEVAAVLAAMLAFVGGAFLAGGAAGLAQLFRAGSGGSREEVAFGPVLLAAFWTVAVLW